MSLSGSIEDLPLLEILQVVSFCQKTGHLTVRAPEGEAGVLFRDGRVVAGYIWEAPEPTPEGLSPRKRIAAILERLVRLREGEFAFNLSDGTLARLAGHDLALVRLDEGINPEELMLDLARRMDEDRRDCAATLEASFSSPADDELVVLEELPLVDTIDVRVPSLPPPVPTSGHASAPPGPTGPAVLLVDDEADVCRVVGQRLSDAGFEVLVAATTAHARHQMLRLAAGKRRFLLAVDLGLPAESGSSFRGGLDVARHASALDPPPPVLLMAEAFDEKLRGRAKRLGVSLLAFKPGISKLDPLQYEADLRAFADKLAKDLLPRLAGRRTAAPGARPAPAPEQAARVATLDNALAEIEANADPDLVAFLLLRAARSFFPRVLLFVAKDDRLRGLAGFGPVEGGASLDLLARGLAVSLDEPSPFADAVASGRAWTGPLPDSGPMRELLERIGSLGARQAAVVPLRASRDTIAVLYGDAPEGAALPEIQPFVAFVERAGRALEDALAARRATQVVA